MKGDEEILVEDFVNRCYRDEFVRFDMGWVKKKFLHDFMFLV